MSGTTDGYGIDNVLWANIPFKLYVKLRLKFKEMTDITFVDNHLQMFIEYLHMLGIKTTTSNKQGYV